LLLSRSTSYRCNTGFPAFRQCADLTRRRAIRYGGILFPRSAMPGKKSPEAPPVPSFESALEELQAIVAKMEDGKLALEESLAAYQRGVELLKLCEARLADAQARIQVLEGDTLKDFTPEETR
jgi:exodeoxyribonuclease VII small subunit